MLRNVGRLDSLTRSIDGAPSDADLALEFNNPYRRVCNKSICYSVFLKVLTFRFKKISA